MAFDAGAYTAEAERDALALLRAAADDDVAAVDVILSVWQGRSASPLLAAMTCTAYRALLGWCDGDVSSVLAKLNQWTSESVAAEATGREQ